MLGAGYLLRGFQLIFKPGIRRFVIIPLTLNVLVFGLLIWYGANQFEALLDWLFSFLPGWLHWLEWLLWPLFILAASVFIFFGFTLLANLIGAPFNGFLAEAVERQITGGEPAQGAWTEIFGEIISGFFGELRKVLYFVLRAIPLLILFLIPGLNLVAPFLWMAFGAWVLALEYADYPMANHGLSFAEQRRRLGEKRLVTLSFGGATLLITLIPGINFLAMPVAVAGATVMWVEQFAGN